MRSGRRGASQRGFTYVMVMAVVALLGLGLGALGPMWAEQARREREQDLLRIGGLYAQAIADYHASSPGSAKRYPPELQSLVLDTRFVGVRRHLRGLYADPLSPGRPWGLVRAPDGGILGVYSQDPRAPLRQAGLDLGVTALPAAQRYSQWLFVPKTAP